MKCPNCGSTIRPAGSKVCRVCNAYQPRARRRAYFVLIPLLAWYAFLFSFPGLVLYTVPVTIAVTVVLIVAWEMLVRVKERNDRPELKRKEV